MDGSRLDPCSPDFVLHVEGDELELLADEVATIPKLFPGPDQDLGVTHGAAVNVDHDLDDIFDDLDKEEEKH